MQFKNLKSRISFIFLSLILVIQVLSFIAIKFSIDKNARLSVSQQLEVGERVFLNIIEHNVESLTVGARILAADFGFKAAIASNDNETIHSALINHQDRINADLAIFYSNSNNKLIFSENLPEDELSSKIETLIHDVQSGLKTNHFAVFKNQSYQLVVVPVKAPLTIGWIVVGFKINDKLALAMNKLSNLDVTFISKFSGGSMVPIASTMSLQSSQQILQATPRKLLAKSKSLELRIDNIDYGTRYLDLYDNGNEKLYVVLQRSINDATEPYQVLLLNILGLSIIGMALFIAGILYLSKVITQPITELANSAKKLEQGDYSFKVAATSQDELGKLSRAFSSMSNAIEERERSILRLAYWDEMTGLPNRASFMQKLSEAIIHAENKHEPLSVVVMNLDRFKQINNIMGHDFGNSLLHAVAQRISEVFRKESDVFARISGDEFAVLLPNTTSSSASKIAQKVSSALETAINISESYVDVTASLGLASYPEHALKFDQLLSFAETAMHISKLKKNGIVVFDSAMDVSSNINLSFASELQNAIAEHQLQLFVQPKISLSTKRVISVEALIRWQHPEKGLIYPDEFVPFAEQNGLIKNISLWMLAEAAHTYKTWLTKGWDIPIAVNISVRDLIDTDLPHKIMDILSMNAVSNSALSLEVTESSIMDDPDRAMQTLLRLHGLGIKLSIDDFGTGYSSLSYLKELPVNELKIDKSFVMELENDLNDKIIVKSTIDLAHNMGLTVVAEGIENEKVWDLLQEMKCDVGQGYFMSRPIRLADFDTWLVAWNKKHNLS